MDESSRRMHSSVNTISLQYVSINMYAKQLQQKKKHCKPRKETYVHRDMNKNIRKHE